MDCPVDQRPLRRTELESALAAFECTQCAGHWLRFGDYLAWRDRQPGDQPEVPPGAETVETTLAAATSGPRWCPDCGYLLTRYHVGRGVAFTLDRCGNCNGVWLDRAEWQTLRARGLHDNLHEMFGPGWQWAARAEERRRQADAQFERQLGAADFARAREFGRWLADHPRRSEILAYLQWQARRGRAGQPDDRSDGSDDVTVGQARPMDYEGVPDQGRRLHVHDSTPASTPAAARLGHRPDQLPDEPPCREVLVTSPPVVSGAPTDPGLIARIARGRIYVRIAIGVFLGVAVAVAALHTWRFGPVRLPVHLGRLAVTAVLMYFLYQGARWARWVTVGLIILGFMVALPTFRGGAWTVERLPGTLAMVALLIAYGVIGRGLLYSESVSAFLDHQRRRRTGEAR